MDNTATGSSQSEVDAGGYCEYFYMEDGAETKAKALKSAETLTSFDNPVYMYTDFSHLSTNHSDPEGESSDQCRAGNASREQAPPEGEHICETLDDNGACMCMASNRCDSVEEEQVDEIPEGDSIEEEDDDSLNWDDEEWDSFDDDGSENESETQRKENSVNIWSDVIPKKPAKDNREIAEFDPIPLEFTESTGVEARNSLDMLSTLLQQAEISSDTDGGDDKVYSQMESFWKSKFRESRRIKSRSGTRRVTSTHEAPPPIIIEDTGQDEVDAPAHLEVVHDSKADAQDRKLFQVANELLETERSYVLNLRHLAVTLYNTLKKENSKNTILDAEAISKVFLNVQSVFAFHDQFMLPRLEERMNVWHRERRIGDVLKVCAPFLKLDAEYVRKYDQCMKDFKEMKAKNRRFRKLMEKFEEKVLHKQGWASVSLYPVQTVPRYILLLKRYIEALPEDSADFADCNDALRKIQSVACYSNETIRKNEDAGRLLEMSKRISGMKEDLFINNRKFITQEDVYVIDPRSGEPLHRHLIMFSDILLVCNPTSVIHASYKVVELLTYKNMMVIEGANPQVPNTLFVNTVRLTLEFAFRSHEVKTEWKKELEIQIERNSTGDKAENLPEKKTSTFVDVLGFRSPIYVRFKDVKSCMVCHKEFSLLWSRHHCKACGMVICGQCSAHQSRLPYMDGTLDRVCDKCFVPLLTKVERRRSEAVLPTKTYPLQEGQGSIRKRMAMSRRTTGRTKSDWFT